MSDQQLYNLLRLLAGMSEFGGSNYKMYNLIYFVHTGAWRIR